METPQAQDPRQVPIEAISDVVGHSNSAITRQVYRHQLGDEIAAAASVWDSITNAAEGSA